MKSGLIRGVFGGMNLVIGDYCKDTKGHITYNCINIFYN
jgi:hypothetical protein